MLNKEEERAYAEQNRRCAAEHINKPPLEFPCPALLQIKKGHKKQKVKISRDAHELQEDSCVEHRLYVGKAAGRIDNADWRLHQLIQTQPEIFPVSLLREIKSKEKPSQHHQQNGVHYLRQPFKKAVVTP